MIELKPEEIRLLSKVGNHSVNEYEGNSTVELLVNYGLLTYSDSSYEIGKLTLPEIKKIALDYGISNKGKKAEIISRITSCVPSEQIKKLKLNKYYVVTEKGQSVIDSNAPLLMWYNGLHHEFIKAEDIVCAQKTCLNNTAYRVLLYAYNSRLSKNIEKLERFSLLLDVKRIYQWMHDFQSVNKIALEIDEVEKALEDEHRSRAAKARAALGLTEDEIQKIREQVMKEMDEDWENELDAKYRKASENKK